MEVIHCVDDQGAAPPEWRGGDVKKMAGTVSTVTAGSVTLRVAVGGSPTVHRINS